MDLQKLMKLHRDCGYRIHRVHDYYFYSRWIRKELFPLNSSFPPNYKISLNKRLVNALKWRFLISPVLIDTKKKDLYEFVLTTNNYELERFDRKVRNRIRKSLQTCDITRPSLEDLLDDGLLINRQTCERQSRKDKLITDKKLWSKYITSIYNDSEYIIWGAYYEKRLIGYLIIYELEGKFNMLQALISRDNSSATNPMCGLMYTAVNSLIKQYGHITLSYGMHIFQAPNPLIRFKQNMLFKIVPLSRAYVINPVLLLLIKPMVFVTIKILHKRNVRYKWLRNILRLYQGHRKLTAELRRNQAHISLDKRSQNPFSLLNVIRKFQTIKS